MINEVDYDQVGADTGGFVEIANTGTAAATLDGTALVLVNGGDGTEYGRKTLTGTLAAGAKLVVDVDPQNGAPDGLALVDTAKDTLLDALSYEGAIHTATIGTKVFDLVEGTLLPVDVADSNTVDGTLARIPDGTDTNNAAGDWSFTTTPTPGAANVKTALRKRSRAATRRTVARVSPENGSGRHPAAVYVTWLTVPSGACWPCLRR